MRPAKRSKLAFVGVLALVLSVTAGLIAGGVADAKKKGKRKGAKAAKTFTVTRTTPQAILPGTATKAFFIKVPIGTVGGKKLKGKVIGFSTVEVTTTYTGSPGFAGFIDAAVIAPNGRSAGLFAPFSNDLATPTETFSGPTTETPNSSAAVCIPISFPGIVQPPCSDPDQTLGPPYAGTIGNPNLLNFKGTSPSGTWNVRLSNFGTTATASLSSITVTGTLINALR